MTRLLLAAAVVFMSATMGFAEMGDDGLHKAPWMRDTFKDLSEDLADANAEGKRLMVIIEQRGC
ncbi:thioredoxin, partial [Planktomarina temperata]|nr:thioredoxin [Planktomarina temperata]